AAIVVGDPAGDIAEVLGDQSELAGPEVDPVGIEDLRVALVQGDDHLVVVVEAGIDYVAADLLERRMVDEVLAVGADRDDVIVLVAFEVLRINDAVRALPYVAGDVAFGLTGDAHRRSAGARAHERVHPL